MTPGQATTETPGQARVTPGQARGTPGKARETPGQATRETQDLATKVTLGQANKDTPGQARVSPDLATRETPGQATRPARSRVKEAQASPQSGARQPQPQAPVTSSEMEHPPATELGHELGLEQPSSAPDLSLEDKTARAAATRAKLRAALGLGALAAKAPAQLGTDPPAPAATPATPPVSNGSDMGEVKVTLKPEKSEAEAEKAARIAATKAKMREALLSAAMVEVGKVGGGARGQGRRLEPGRGQEEGQGRGQGRRLSAPLPPGRRSSGAGGEGETRNTIWEFFEEGKKKGTCKTCGYVVATKHNHGGLTR